MLQLKINRFINSYAMVALAGILMLIGARLAFQQGDISYFTFDRGIAFPSANLWITSSWVTMVANTALILLTALGWMVLIRLFNPFRALTSLPASFFLIMMLSVPDMLDQLYTGSILAAVMPLCLGLLWSCFDNETTLRRIFLIFVILSALSMTQYCFAVYIPIFVVGCLQMKIFSLRTLSAILLGVITPWWIVLGTGLVDLSDIHFPETVNMFRVYDTDELFSTLVTIGVTVLLLVIGWFANFMNVLTLNANLRAFNGSMSLVGVVTILAMIIDFTNAAAYLPTLMLIASYELSYMAGINKGQQRYIPVIVIMLFYLGVFAYSLFAAA